MSASPRGMAPPPFSRHVYIPVAKDLSLRIDAGRLLGMGKAKRKKETGHVMDETRICSSVVGVKLAKRSLHVKLRNGLERI